MSNFVAITAKAVTQEEQSDSIVVSFGAKWYKHLMAKDFSTVIRKRIPNNRSFRWMYFHINSPFSAICGRAEIEMIYTATSKEAITLAKQINLSVDNILGYIGNSGNIGCYKLGTLQLCAKPISIVELATRLVYYPPQSFFILAKQAKNIIDELSNFNTQSASLPREAGNS